MHKILQKFPIRYYLCLLEDDLHKNGFFFLFQLIVFFLSLLLFTFSFYFICDARVTSEKNTAFLLSTETLE